MRIAPITPRSQRFYLAVRCQRCRHALLNTAREVNVTSCRRHRAPRPRHATTAGARPSFPSFVPQPEANEISEPAALDMLASYQSVDLSVESLPGTVRTSYVGPSLAEGCSGTSAGQPQRSDEPFLLLHGFDSSAVEWRRTLPRLAQHKETYALDLLGCATRCLM